MKSVLISVRPKWCAPITTRDKLWEIRKTRPKIPPPFKCYLYATLGDIHEALLIGDQGGQLMPCSDYRMAIPTGGYIGNGKVISEFVCDDLVCLQALLVRGEMHLYNTVSLDKTGLTQGELFEYLYDGKGGIGWAWHISQLKVYDNPRALGEFMHPCERAACVGCEYGYQDGKVCTAYLTRPPQSWCYVEEWRE